MPTLKVVHSAATRAGNKMIFGKEVDVKAKPGSKKLKANPCECRLRQRLELPRAGGPCDSAGMVRSPPPLKKRKHLDRRDRDSRDRDRETDI